MQHSQKVISFIGGGNMARSIIGGLLASGWSVDNIKASDPSESQRQLLETQFSIRCFESNLHAVTNSEIVVLAVKPQMMKTAVQSIHRELASTNPLIISIAAGIRIADILRWIGHDMPFIRVMPNTPSLVNCGVSGLLANSLVTDSHRQDAETIMDAVGQTVWVDSENLIDVVTGISGSGPAYYFKLMEIMIESAISHGLNEKAAKMLVLQTALGAAKLANQSEFPPKELRRQVTSPGGTTEAALATMEEYKIDQTVSKGIDAAIAKSDELAISLGGS